MNNGDKRIILAALRSYEGALQECLKDPELMPDERKGFEVRADMVANLIDQMTPKVRVEVTQFDAAKQKWNAWRRVFQVGESSIGQMVETVLDLYTGFPFEREEDYQINVSEVR